MTKRGPWTGGRTIKYSLIALTGQILDGCLAIEKVKPLPAWSLFESAMWNSMDSWRILKSWNCIVWSGPPFLQETSPTLKNPQKANKKEAENNLVSNMEVQTWGSTFNILANNGFVIGRWLSSCEPLTRIEPSSNLFTTKCCVTSGQLLILMKNSKPKI